MIDWNSKNASALVALQRGIPIVENPFAELASTCGMSETDLLAFAQSLLDNGEARRFGAVFDARRLGYRSALCAIQVPPPDLARVAGIVAAVPGVTHAYERRSVEVEKLKSREVEELRSREVERLKSPEMETSQLLDSSTSPFLNFPNLWFTFAAPAPLFDGALATLRADCAPYPIDVLPALRRFKIDVIFDARTRDRDEEVEIEKLKNPEVEKLKALSDSSTSLFLNSSTSQLGLSPPQQGIIRLLQGALPLAPRFFAPLAERLGMSEGALLGQLREWQGSGVLRRIGLLLRHREAGFKANGMCCWDIPEGEVLEAGRRVAGAPEVTHCYERPRSPRFPFTLYAMIHTPSWQETCALFERITRDAALPPGQLLLSFTEFKKTSMRFF